MQHNASIHEQHVDIGEVLPFTILLGVIQARVYK